MAPDGTRSFLGARQLRPRAACRQPPLGRFRPVAPKSIALFVVAAICEIGGAYLMWQAIKEDRGLWFGLAGAAALVGYGAVAALQPEPHFGRVLAAYGGVFIAGSLAWGIVFDGFRPDRFDLAGAAVALVGMAIIMYSPR